MVLVISTVIRGEGWLGFFRRESRRFFWAVVEANMWLVGVLTISFVNTLSGFIICQFNFFVKSRSIVLYLLSRAC